MAAVYKALSGTGAHSNAVATTSSSSSRPPKNAQRVLILSSRGINLRARHLLNDLASLLPHSRRESKFDSKKNLRSLAELAELYNCNNVLFFECRKRQDVYLHLSKCPNGPTAKLLVQNIHTMEELNFGGNCLKGSRPILSFDLAFETEPSLRLLRELLSHVFGVPKSSRKIKPFVDHVMAFSVLDGKIWVRIYQINEEDTTNNTAQTTTDHNHMSLLEIGPRFCLTPVFIQEGCFSGPIVYSNKHYVSPNQIRSDMRKRVAIKHSTRAEQEVARFAKKGELGISTGSKDKRADALDSKTLFA